MNHLDDFTLNEFLDHTLDESVHADAEIHLQTCADCRARLEELQILLGELEDLSEVHLEHDLTPTILARLPRKEPVSAWTRAFAVQTGVTTGFILWLGMQIAPLIRFPRLNFPSLLKIELQTFYMRLLTLRFLTSEFRFPDLHFHFPEFGFQLPTINLQPSTSHMIVLSLSALTLWIVGNMVLLRSRKDTSP